MRYAEGAKYRSHVNPNDDSKYQQHLALASVSCLQSQVQHGALCSVSAVQVPTMPRPSVIRRTRPQIYIAIHSWIIAMSAL